MIIAGIDYSMTSPCICIFSGEVFNYDGCKFYFLTPNKKFAKVDKLGKYAGSIHLEYSVSAERYYNIARWAISILHLHDCRNILIEGYSYGSRAGMLFNIAENTSILKYKLWRGKKEFEIVPPSTIKKFATGKGNANKDLMFDSFLAETKDDMRLKIFEKPNKLTNPVTDLVDSYFIVKYLYEQKFDKSN